MYSLRYGKVLILLSLSIVFFMMALSACGYQTTISSNIITASMERTSYPTTTTVPEMNAPFQKTGPTMEQGSVTALISGNTDDNKAFYPRMVELDNGDLLATFMRADPTTQGWVGTKSYNFYKSSDKGKTWSFVSELNPEEFGLPTEKQGFATLLVLPQQMGDYPSGTVLFAVTNWHQDYDVIHLWRSYNNGLTWEKHSSFVPRIGTSNKMDAWEPEFTVSSDGWLVCFYADERQDGYNQCIAREVSYDGGITWSDYAIIVGDDDHFWRPGMPRVVRLKNGQYFLIYENVNSDPSSAVRFKTSSDGLNWGNPAEPGTLVGTSETNYSAACPELGYMDDGSSFGQLFVRGMEDKCPSTKFYSSKDMGKTWTVTDAPLEVAGSISTKAGYSGTLLALENNVLLEINAVNNGTFNEIRAGMIMVKEDIGQ